MQKNNPNKSFAKVVRKRLIDLEMSQMELASQIGINKAYLTRILNGDRSGKTYLDKIKEVLGLNKAA